MVSFSILLALKLKINPIYSERSDFIISSHMHSLLTTRGLSQLQNSMPRK